MKVLPITSVICVFKRLSTMSRPSIMNLPWLPSWPERDGVTMRIKWLPLTLSEEPLQTPKSLTPFSMVSHTQKELLPWNNSLSSCQKKSSPKLSLNISINSNGKMPPWTILLMLWKIISKPKISPWPNGDNFGCREPVATRSNQFGIHKTKLKRHSYKSDRHVF